MIFLTRVYDFCASHRLYNPELSDADNEKIYGKCASANGHGHNYTLEVTVSGLPDETTGMVVNLEQLDHWVMRQLIDHVDHKHLNHDVDFLQGVNPTAENLVVAFWERLQGDAFHPGHLSELCLIETPRNSARYHGR